MAFNPFASDQVIKAGRLTFATVGSNPVEPYLNAIYEPSTLTPAMTLIAGNVGIGTAIPLQGVHIAKRTAFTANVGIGTTNPQLPLDVWNTSAIRIPSGTVEERPSIPLDGTIRYNTTTQQFEGYGAGNTWGSLGGVKSVDGATYITAESFPGAGDSNIRFYTANQIRIFVDANGNVGIGTTLPTEKLLVEGNIYAKGTVYTSNLKVLGATTILDTTTSNTEQLIITNDGTGPALQVTQTGPQPVAQFIDAESGTALFISGDGNIGIGTQTPRQRLEVSGNAIFLNSVGFGTAIPKAPLDIYNNVTVKLGANVGFGTITDSRLQVLESLFEYPPPNSAGSITSNVFTINGEPNGNGVYHIRTSSEQDTSYQGYMAFDKSSDWTQHTWISSNSSMPAYLDIELPIPIQLKQYTLTNGNSGTGLGTSTAPKSWQVQASTDGITYQTLFVETNVLWTSENQTKLFKTPSVLKRYRFYRLTIVESYTPSQTHVAEWKLFGYETKNYALFNDIYVGIGTTTPRAELDVEGTSLIHTLITSNITILGNSFIGQDNPNLRSRLQIAPINALTQVSLEGTTHFQYITPGLWKYDPSKTQLYINGSKLAYYSSNLKDYDVTYESNGTENTLVTVILDEPAKYGDVLDITFWPSYLDANALMQPGYMVQNINYSQWNIDANTSNIFFTQGNVGIGTNYPSSKLQIVGDVNISQTIASSNVLTQQGTFGKLFVLNHITPNDNTPVADFYDNGVLAMRIANGANVGIGTVLPSTKLAIEGNASVTQEIQWIHPSTRTTQSTLQYVDGLGLKTTFTSNAVWYANGTSNELMRFTSDGLLGIGTALPRAQLDIEGHVSVSCNLTVKGFITTSNLIILGETLTLNTTTSNTDQLTIQNDGSGPALTVIQTGAEPIAQFIDAESGTALFIANTGKVGFGTTLPNVALNVYSTDALRIPVGSEDQKPSGQLGYVRYNTTTQQYEGYGAGNTWGSLGGVKSVDGATYITAESTPGTGDSNLRFYTSGIQQALLNSKGNLGLGTTSVPSRLYVEGDAIVSGTLTASNLNVVYKQFYNNDSLVFQTRLQVAPIQYQYINPLNNTTSNSFQIEGLWKVEPLKTQVFINGIKQVYVASNLKDYDTSYVHVGSNTLVTVYFDSALNSEDIVDLTVWPSYISSNSLLEPGFAIQNINYTIWNSNSSTQSLTYVDGNVGIGTIVPSHTLTVKGDILADGTVYASNMVVLGATTILDTVTSNTERLIIQNAGSGPALQVTQSGAQPVADFYDDNVLAMRIADGANVGIGTSLPKYRLDVNGTTLVQQLNIVRASDQSSDSLTLQSMGDALQIGSSSTNISINDNRIYMNGNVGIGTTLPKAKLHVQESLYVSSNITALGNITTDGTITASNLVILGDTVILQTTTCNTEVLYVHNTGTGPALQVTQSGAQPIAQFVDAESGVGLYIANQGKLGIGTAIPITTLDIQATDALRIPTGTEAQKPIGQLGYIRYNTTTQQYEGYGAGNAWGSLGGVKSIDGVTYITAELAPGASDSNLRFYTTGSANPAMLLNSKGNLGIGTISVPSRLYVEGDTIVSGTLTASNLNVVYKQFYNNDSTVFQNRLQLAPINVQFINILPSNTSNQIIVDGLWKFEASKTQVFLNGAKLIYLSSNQKDFDVSYSHQSSNTQVTILFDNPLEYQDIIDITLWPSYLDNNALLQPGFTLQNILYSTSNIATPIWSSNNANGDIFYTQGNVGLGTSSVRAPLDIIGTIRLQNPSTNVQSPLLDIYNQDSCNLFYIGTNGNIGIGTQQAEARLDVKGTIRTPILEFQQGFGSIALENTSNFVSRLNSADILTRYTWMFGSNEKMILLQSGNVGIGTILPIATLHVDGSIYTPGTITASNLNILGDTIILNSITSNTEQLIIQNAGTGPALHVTQSGFEPIAHFIDAETGTALFIGNTGWVGIGTTQSEVSLSIESTNALRIPVGTNNDRPAITRLGQIRYNTSTQQYEGYGAGNAWGSLGGVKSVDGLTYISAESTPGTGDCNLRFYTGGIQRGIVNPLGNLGIGTITPQAKLHVEGDMIVNGLFTVSNVNITGNSFSNAYNNDSVAFRSRLQINPTRYVETVSASYKNTFQLTISGLYAVYPENVEVYINGTKYAYASASSHDYTIDTSLTTTSTLLTVTLDENIFSGDVIEIIAWPSYINDSMGMQPGFVVQNIQIVNPNGRSVLSQPMIQPLQPAPRRFTYDITSNQTIFTETIPALLEFTSSRTEVYLSGFRLLYTPTFQDYTVSYTQSFSTTTVTLTLSNPATAGDILEIYYYATPISTDFGSNFSGVIYQDYTYFQKGDGTNSNIVYPYGNLGIGTTYALNPLHVRGNITFDGLMYDETGKAIWIPGSMVEWKPCTYPNPSLNAPGTGVFTIALRKGQFKYMGNELVYHFKVEGSVGTKPSIITNNYTLSLEYPVDSSFYSSETIIGDAWITITSGGTKTTYKAYLQTVVGNTSLLNVRYVNGTYDNSLSELNVGTSVTLQGTLVYKTAYMSTEQGIPKSYLPNSFVQNTLGYTGLNNGGVPARARLDIIETGGMTSCNLPVMILDQRGSNDSIFEIRSNASELQFVVNRYGNVGIGTHASTEKLIINGDVKATAFIGDGSQLTGLGGYSIWSILNSSNISYSNHVLLGNQASLTHSPQVLNIVDSLNATARLWSYCNLNIGENTLVPSIEWIRGDQATPDAIGNAWWDTYIASDRTLRIRNRTENKNADVAIFGTSNVQIQGILNVQSNATVAGTLYASNLQILGDFVTLNTITSNTEQFIVRNDGTGPALRVVQTGNHSVAEFYDNETGPSLIIANNGNIGIGTFNPRIVLDIISSSAISLPKGTLAERPFIAQKGYIRYNTELDQFEGYGPSNTWGSLGGVKSIDGSTYITAEVVPGGNDSNLRFYTGGVSRMVIGSNGNIGIGTQSTNASVHVQGDMIVTGIFTTSNINIVGKDFFYNNDSTTFRSRLQLSPYTFRIIAPYTNYTTHAVTVEGLWKFESEKSEIYLNGIKLAYIQSNMYDYTVTSSNQGLNTDILIQFENETVGMNDVLDIVLWPSYINDSVTMQPGYMLQNIYNNNSYWSCNVLTQDLSYSIANIGIGTTLPKSQLHVEGSILTSNLTACILSVTQSTVTEDIAQFYTSNQAIPALYIINDGNVGIGTSKSLQKLHVEGNLVIRHSNENGLGSTRVDVMGISPIIGVRDYNASNEHLYITTSAQTSYIRAGGASQGLRFEIANNTQGNYEEQSYQTALTLLPNTNVGIGTTLPKEQLHVQNNLFVSANATVLGTLLTSNLTILGDTITLNTLTSNTEQLIVTNTGTGPALLVTQTGSQPVAQFVDAESGIAMMIADTGKIGIGTISPSVSMDIRSSDALRIPVGTEEQKPTGQLGYIRYNTTTQQYEGYGIGNAWGSLGGVKSVDGATYITAELTPGFGDSNLRFYTGGIQRALLNSNAFAVSGSVQATSFVGDGSQLTGVVASGIASQWLTIGSTLYLPSQSNVGIGTTVATTDLHVQGDMLVTGLFTTSNINIVGKEFSYNNDVVSFRNRLQLQPYHIHTIVPNENYLSHTIIIDGLWKFEPDQTQLHVNGTKMIYISSNLKDYDVTYALGTSNTTVTILFETDSLTTNDVLDITMWPSYISDDMTLQPGYSIQNISYVNSNALPFVNNSGYITLNQNTAPRARLDIREDSGNSNLPVIVLDQDGPASDILQTRTNGIIKTIIDKNGNVGIGTTYAPKKLMVQGDINFSGTLYQNGVEFKSSSSTQTYNNNTQVVKYAIGGLEINATGNYYVGARMTWTNMVSSAMGKIQLSGKCTVASTDQDNAYRRFETIVTTQNDNATRPKGIVNTESANYYTSAFTTGINHEVVRYSSNAVDIKVKWNTNLGVTAYTINMQLEVVAPTSIGNITFTDLYGSY
jgi:hypothetical protein